MNKTKLNIGKKGSLALSRKSAHIRPILKAKPLRSETLEKERYEKISKLNLKTPAYVIDEVLLEKNMEMIKYIKDKSGCKILLALKAFSAFSAFPMMRKYLDGVCASGLYEARLGFEEFQKEVQTFSPAYTEDDLCKITKYSNKIVFNSVEQLKKYGPLVKERGLQIGLRVNPKYSTAKIKLYDPCAPNSRFGATDEQLREEDLSLVDGFHFHALLWENADGLERVLEHFEMRYGQYIRKNNIKWVNFGGGHHLTKKDYDAEKLIKIILEFKKRYGVDVYLEPGEGIVHNAGVLVASVIDIVKNGMDIAILDTSAETHMPDILEIPYNPQVLNAGKVNEKKYAYRLGGNTCLSGDIMGDYSFDKPLKSKDKIVFLDQAHYTMVKNNTFNGLNLPSIAIFRRNDKLDIVRTFTYEDFKNRLS